MNWICISLQNIRTLKCTFTLLCQMNRWTESVQVCKTYADSNAHSHYSVRWTDELNEYKSANIRRLKCTFTLLCQMNRRTESVQVCKTYADSNTHIHMHITLSDEQTNWNLYKSAKHTQTQIHIHITLSDDTWIHKLHVTLETYTVNWCFSSEAVFFPKKN